MSESVDKFLHRLDQEEKLSELAETWGCEENQRRAFVKLFEDGKVLSWSGVRMLFHIGDGTTTTAIDDPRCKAYLTEHYAFLFPTPKAADTRITDLNVRVDGAVIEQALAGNKTALGTVARSFAAPGKEPTAADVAAAELYLKAKRGGNGGLDNTAPAHRDASHTTNPWSAEHWNVTKQGSIVKGLGVERAASIAKSANSFIGATRPAK